MSSKWKIKFDWAECEWKIKKNDSVFETNQNVLNDVNHKKNEMVMIKWVKGQDHICERSEQKKKVKWRTE